MHAWMCAVFSFFLCRFCFFVRLFIRFIRFCCYFFVHFRVSVSERPNSVPRFCHYRGVALLVITFVIVANTTFVVWLFFAAAAVLHTVFLCVAVVIVVRLFHRLFLFSLFLTTAAIALERYDLLLCYCSRRLYYTNTEIVCLLLRIYREEKKWKKNSQHRWDNVCIDIIMSLSHTCMHQMTTIFK